MMWRCSVEDLLSVNFRRDIRNNRDLKRPIDSEPCLLLDDLSSDITFAGTKKHMLAAKTREEICTRDGGLSLSTPS